MYSKQVLDLALAIAHAEGFGVPNTVPTRAHNPGDLKVLGWKGPTTGTENIPVFDSDEEGWDYLHLQIQRMCDGNSHVYTLRMTFEEMAKKWTDTQSDNWINNVISKLTELGYKVDKLTTLVNFFHFTTA